MRHIVSYLVFSVAVGAALAAFLPTLVPWYAAIAVVGGLLLLLDLAKGPGLRSTLELSSRPPVDSRPSAVAEPERAAAQAVEAKRDRRWDVPGSRPVPDSHVRAGQAR